MLAGCHISGLHWGRKGWWLNSSQWVQSLCSSSGCFASLDIPKGLIPSCISFAHEEQPSCGLGTSGALQELPWGYVSLHCSRWRLLAGFVDSCRAALLLVFPPGLFAFYSITWFILSSYLSILPLSYTFQSQPEAFLRKLDIRHWAKWKNISVLSPFQRFKLKVVFAFTFLPHLTFPVWQKQELLTGPGLRLGQSPCLSPPKPELIMV